MKRFAVVQDAQGFWGILDTGVLEHLGPKRAFASFGRHRMAKGMFGIMVEEAVFLNQMQRNRDDYFWSEYAARR